jgi:hypothetical protein
LDVSVGTVTLPGTPTPMPNNIFAQDSRGLNIRAFYLVTDGSDYSPALGKAIAKFNSNYASGSFTPVYIPSGIWPLNTPLATQFAPSVPASLGGNRMFSSFLELGSGFTGTLFSCSQTPVQFTTPTILPNINAGATGNNNGCNLHDISITGNTASTGQDAIVLSDNVDSARIERVSVYDVPGYCLSAGGTLNQTHAFLRESNVEDLTCYNTGTATKPAIDISSTGTQDASNVDDFHKIRVYSSVGEGFVLENGNITSPVRQITLDAVNVENSLGGSNYRIGSTALTGFVQSIVLQNVLAVSPSAGNYNFLITAAGTSSAVSNITLDNARSMPGAGTGGGLNVQYGKNIAINFSTATAAGTQVTVGCGLTGYLSIKGQGDEASYTKSVCGTLTPGLLRIANDPTYNPQVMSSLSIGSGGGTVTAIDSTGGTLATKTNVSAALPSATTGQLYGGSGAAGVAQAVTPGAGLALSSGTLSATAAASSTSCTLISTTTTTTLATLFPTAKIFSATVLSAGNAGASGVTSVTGTAYSGGSGASGGGRCDVPWQSVANFPSSITLVVGTAGVHGTPPSNGVAGTSSSAFGYIAYPAGTSSVGGTAVNAASGGTGGCMGGAGGNSSGTTAGTAPVLGGLNGVGISAGNSAPTSQSTPGSGAAGVNAAAGALGGASISGASGAGSGAGMATVQALLAGGNGGRAGIITNALGGTTAGAAGAAGTTVAGQLQGSGGAGGANNSAGVGGAGGAGALGAGGGGGGDGSTGGGPGGDGGPAGIQICGAS